MDVMNSIPWPETRRQLKSFVYRRVNDAAAADDIVHDVFLKVHAAIHQLKSPERTNGWIYQITRHAITDYFRTKRKLANTLDQPTTQEDNENEFNECVANCLQDEMKALPTKYREALELAELGSVSQTELATRLDISYSGAKSRVQRARQMLKSKMDEKYTIKTDSYGNVIVCEDRAVCDCPGDSLQDRT